MSKNNFGLVEMVVVAAAEWTGKIPSETTVAGHATWGSPVFFP